MHTLKKIPTKAIAFVSVCVALNVICAWITVPYFAVPFTLSTFGIFFSLYFLGAKKGTFAILIYILLGLIGVPVFSGFKSGVPALAGATGGYILGFLASGLVYLFFDRKNKILRIVGLFIGLLICYAAGTAWFVFVSGRGGNPISFYTALTMCVFPFVLVDIAKISLAVIVSDLLKKHHAFLQL